LFLDYALIQDHDSVDPLECRYAVRDKQNGVAAEVSPKILEDLLFRWHIYGGGGFIEYNQLGFLQYGPSDCQPLFLSSG
jgi:hypothetical protein